MSKGFFLKAAATIGLAAAQLLPGLAHAADPWPSQPIKLIVGFAAGGGTDVIARAVAQSLSTRLGQPVIVENKPGAGGSLGMIAGAAAAPDGYTLTLGSNGTMTLNTLLYPNLKYQVERDFTPIGGLASLPYLIAANPQVPANDIKGLVALAKTRQVTYASAGNGTTNHLVGVLLESMSKTDMLHVPYRGAAPAMNDVVAGQVNFLSGDLSTLAPMVQSGKLKALAVTGPNRQAIMPNVPTVAESGFPGFEAMGWFALYGPKGLPAAVVQRINTELPHVLKDPAVLRRLGDLGATPLALGPEPLAAMVRNETQKWRKVITDNKVTADALQ